jgi:hypothetical protein
VFLPTVAIGLTASSHNKLPEGTLLELAKLIILMYVAIKADEAENYLVVALPALCASLAGRAITPSSELVTFSGRALTHMATAQPDLFRKHIATLPTEYKLVLQQVMKIALSQQAQTGTSPGPNASGDAGLKKKFSLESKKFHKV